MPTLRSYPAAALVLSALFLWSACAASRPGDARRAAPEIDGAVRFVVVGDMPYNPEQHAMLELPDGPIAAAIRAAKPPLLLHLGDLKAGAAACTDSVLTERRDQIFRLNPYRTVYTPGDNDWTDCDRAHLAARFDELERLDFLRALFYQGEGRELERDVPGLVRQNGFVENARWKMQGLAFGTLHVPGTNNGRREILLGDTDRALDEADRRDAADEAWVDTLFASADSAAGLVIAFHADIYRPSLSSPYAACSPQERTACDGHKRLRDRIERRAAIYGKPVLLIHGDTGPYCLHRPAEGLAPRLWRLNAPGDFAVLDAAQVVFDPGNAGRPFEVRTLVEASAPQRTCEYGR